MNTPLTSQPIGMIVLITYTMMIAIIISTIIVVGTSLIPRLAALHHGHAPAGEHAAILTAALVTNLIPELKPKPAQTQTVAEQLLVSLLSLKHAPTQETQTGQYAALQGQHARVIINANTLRGQILVCQKAVLLEPWSIQMMIHALDYA